MEEYNTRVYYSGIDGQMEKIAFQDDPADTLIVNRSGSSHVPRYSRDRLQRANPYNDDELEESVLAA